MPTDANLLRRYVEGHAEDAFADLVHRHLNLVFSAALRRTGGRHALAEEIAQKVFSDLARKAAQLTDHPSLAGWLYRCTRYAAIDGIRAEIRREKLVQTLSAMPDSFSPRDAHLEWERLRPVIDEAMDQLKEPDREVMLLRFFQGLSFAEVGAKLNLPANTARMRTERALDKLRCHLSKRGITSTATLAGMLTAQSIVAAPASLAATVTSTALAAASASGTGVLATIFMSKIILPSASAALAAGVATLVWTTVAPGVGAEELATLRADNVRLTQATAPEAPAAAVSAVASEYALQATAVARAVTKKHAVSAQAATASGAARSTSTVNAGGHRDRGQATPHDAFMSFAWAGDAAEIGALAKLLFFEPALREQALAVHASMPEALRIQYPTPEELYAFFFAADALVAPPPGADTLEGFAPVELSPGRVALRRPGSRKNHHQYQQTASGWKWVVPQDAIRGAPEILCNETLAKLGAP